MHLLKSESSDLRTLGTTVLGCIRVGWLVEISAEGYLMVDFPGNDSSPLRARTVVDSFCSAEERAAVLLVFENGDPTLPIILGFVRDALPQPASNADAIIERRRIVFDAKEELVLRSGKSSLVLRKDGKIVTKGSTVVSRASGAHKIKGSSVRIN